ncbi:GNAT family N-acetyltransferase [Deinococcus radiotolerans]|uniref:GNAT family N-acetyltransferase n=1 Tax=Deinococcus radiotolerans TaxID=1309407 RepID=A0ABQ2FG51_9DEIO|nr:GNAT family N-acetyltransferase [Deinococcus radiotolerans]GGK88052.1 GNAT family N-acetyltransferase [Deinococcus radiotolerans]
MTTTSVAVQHRDHTALTEEFAHALVAHLNRLRAESHPDDPPADPANIWGQMQHLPPILELDFWTVEEDGQIVAHARTQLFTVGDNQHLAELELMVSPAARGRGLGRTLLGHAAQAMQVRGRTLLMAQTNDRVPAGDVFARRAGFQPGLSNHVNRLLLSDVPEGLLDAWTTRPDDGYTLEVWTDGVPDADLDAYAELLNVMNSAPRDDLDVEDHRTTPEEVRSMETLARAGGRTSVVAVVRAPDGTLVGLTDVSWRPAQPRIVAQGNTGVRPEHRGHSLGRWLKAANVQATQRLNPHAREIRTQNADSNGPMLKINTELGFRPFMASTIWQGDTTEVLKQLQKELT